MTDSQTGQLLDAAQDGPNADRIPMDIPADAPTEVTGPSSVPSKTTTTSKSDGSSSVDHYDFDGHQLPAELHHHQSANHDHKHVPLITP
jgi:hypothetical protein